MYVRMYVSRDVCSYKWSGWRDLHMCIIVCTSCVRTYVCIHMHTTYVQYIYVYCTSALVFHVGSPLHSCYPFDVDALVLCDGVSEWRGPDVSYSISKKIPPWKSHVSDNTCLGTTYIITTTLSAGLSATFSCLYVHTYILMYVFTMELIYVTTYVYTYVPIYVRRIASHVSHLSLHI